jgi:hypothetical protein
MVGMHGAHTHKEWTTLLYIVPVLQQVQLWPGLEGKGVQNTGIEWKGTKGKYIFQETMMHIAWVIHKEA